MPKRKRRKTRSMAAAKSSKTRKAKRKTTKKKGKKKKQVGCIVLAAGAARTPEERAWPPRWPSPFDFERSAAQHIAEQLPGLAREALQLHLLDRCEAVGRRVDLDARQQHG